MQTGDNLDSFFCLFKDIVGLIDKSGAQFRLKIKLSNIKYVLSTCDVICYHGHNFVPRHISEEKKRKGLLLWLLSWELVVPRVKTGQGRPDFGGFKFVLYHYY